MKRPLELRIFLPSLVIYLAGNLLPFLKGRTGNFNLLRHLFYRYRFANKLFDLA